MLELLTAFAKYVGAFINAALTKLKKELDVKFQELTTDYNNKITELENKTSRKVKIKKSSEEVSKVIDDIIVDDKSIIDMEVVDSTVTFSNKRLMSIIEDNSGNKLNIAESGIKIIADETIKVTLDPLSKELYLSVNNATESFVYESTETSVRHQIKHDLDSFNLNMTVLSKDLNGAYIVTYGGISYNSTNEVTIELTEGQQILCIIQKVK